MADSGRSLALRLAITGLEDARRRIVGFGKEGKEAFDDFAAKATGANAALDKLAAPRNGGEQLARAFAATTTAIDGQSRAANGLFGTLAKIATLSDQVAQAQTRQASASRGLFGNLGSIAAAQAASGGAPTGGASQAAAQIAQSRQIVAATDEVAASAQRAAAARRELEAAKDQASAAADVAALKAEAAALAALEDVATRVRRTLDPGVDLDRQRAQAAELVRRELLTEAEAYDHLRESALKAAGLTREQVAGNAPASLGAFANINNATGSGALAVEEARAHAAAAAASKEEADAKALLQRQTDQLRASLSQEIQVRRELDRIAELAENTNLTAAERAQAESAAVERITGAKAAERAENERLAASANALLRSLDASIGLDEQRAQASELVRRGLITQADAYEHLTQAALKAAGVQKPTSEDAPDSVGRFANVNNPAGSASLAVEELRQQRDRIAAAKQEQDAVVALRNEKVQAAQRIIAQYEPQTVLTQRLAEIEKARASGLPQETTLLRARAAAEAEAAEAERRLAAGTAAASSGGGKYAFANVAQQIQDVSVQFQSGTDKAVIFAQQGPQIASAFGPVGAILGGVAAVAVVAGGAFLGLRDAAKEATDAAKKQAEETKGLLEAFDVVTGSADKFAQSLANLSAGQKGLVDLSVTQDLEKQREALAKLGEARDKAFKEVPVETAAGSKGFLQSILENDTPFQDKGDQQANKVYSDAAREEIQLYREQAVSALELRDAIAGIYQAQGQSEETARKNADTVLANEVAYQRQAEAVRLAEAQQRIALGTADDTDRAFVNQKQSLQEATAAATAYGNVLENLTDQLDSAGSKRDRFIAQQVKAAQIDKLPADQQAQARETTAGAAGAVYDANKTTADTNKLKEAEAELAAQHRELASGYGTVAAAGEKAAEQRRKQLTDTEGHLIPGAEKLIKLSRDQAEEEKRQQLASQAAKKDTSAADRIDKFIEKTHEETEATKRLLDVTGLSSAEIRKAQAVREAENQVIGAGIKQSDKRYQQLVDERTANIEATRAAQDRLKLQEQLNALDERVAGVGVAGYSAGGKALGAAELVGLSEQDVKDAEQRAQAVRSALAAIPDSLKDDESARADVIRHSTDAVNADIAANKARNRVLASNELDRSLQDETDLYGALQLGLKAYQDQKDAIDARNQALRDGFDPNSPEGQEQVAKIRTQIDVGRVSAAELERQKQNAEDLAAIVRAPFEGLASAVQGTVDQLLGDLAQGNFSLKKTLGGFTDSLRSSTTGALSQLAAKPIKDAQTAFLANLDKGQSFGEALNGAFKTNPLGSGAAVGSAVGSVGGAIGQGVTGNPNAGIGGTVGGLVGGIAGAYFGPVGSLVGSTIGSAAGSFLGSLFGDSVANNRANLQYSAGGTHYDPRARGNPGVYYEDESSSPENRRQVNVFADQLEATRRVIASVGGTFGFLAQKFASGDESGIEYNGEKFSSPESALKAAIQDLAGAATVKGDKTLATVLQNTRGGTPQAVQEDIAFARQYDVLTGKVGTYGSALRDLQTQFQQATFRAEELGLGTKALKDAQAEAEADLRDKSRQQISALVGDSGPLASALFDLRQKFKDAAEDAAALGFTTAQLAAAQAEQEAVLRTQAANQYAQLTGQAGGFAQGLAQIAENFRQAKAIGGDLGIDTSNLGQLQSAAEAKLRASYERQVAQLTGSGSAFAQALADLNERFEQAIDIQRELGQSTTETARLQLEAQRDLARETERQLVEQQRSQADQIRSFLSGIIDPLKQAVSGFGGLQGIVSPQESLKAGLAEFRTTLKAAQGDDLTALQNLPGLGTRLIDLAKQYGGTGADFASILKEVTDGINTVLGQQQGRAEQITQSIPDTLRQTAGAQIDTLVQGFRSVTDELAKTRADIERLLGPAQVAAQAAAQAAAQQQTAPANQNVQPTVVVDPTPVAPTVASPTIAGPSVAAPAAEVERERGRVARAAREARADREADGARQARRQAEREQAARVERQAQRQAEERADREETARRAARGVRPDLYAVGDGRGRGNGNGNDTSLYAVGDPRSRGTGLDLSLYSVGDGVTGASYANSLPSGDSRVPPTPYPPAPTGDSRPPPSGVSDDRLLALIERHIQATLAAADSTRLGLIDQTKELRAELGQARAENRELRNRLDRVLERKRA